MFIWCCNNTDYENNPPNSPAFFRLAFFLCLAKKNLIAGVTVTREGDKVHLKEKVLKFLHLWDSGMWRQVCSGICIKWYN